MGDMPVVEPLRGAPSFLSLSGWRGESRTVEIVSRPRLDTRQIVPYFDHQGVRHVGIMERERASRAVRGAPLVGWEPVEIDLSQVDETGDILSHGRAVFAAEAGVTIDPAGLAIPLPSYARSIGYLTELALPLAVAVVPPASPDVVVRCGEAVQTVKFRPLEDWLDELARGAVPHSEDLSLILSALCPPGVTASGRSHDLATARLHSPGIEALLEREAGRVRTAAALSRDVHSDLSIPGTRMAFGNAEELRFLKLSSVQQAGRAWEVVTPGTGFSLAMMPYLRRSGMTHFLLWREVRECTLERRARQPLFDTPISVHHVNATACFLRAEDHARARHPEGLMKLTQELLARALGPTTLVRSVIPLGAGEPAPAVSSELRTRVACELDATSIGPLPDDVIIVSAVELARAIADGAVRDPVVVASLLQLSASLGLDPFVEARQGPVAPRRAFLDAMTTGSVVERRLRGYSSIESEQLGSPTYARLMTLLQHTHGVRIAYPVATSDRSFFKAAFRVFMAADRGEDRALQGLHFSHDAYHFGLGNFTLPAPADFAAWYVSGAPLPPRLPEDGEPWMAYHRALKAAEDEATFFSFYTLFDEQPSLASHVPTLTYWRALQEMGITSRAEARAIFDALTCRSELPLGVAENPVYRAREDVRGVFSYMLGFRDYHRGDIATAFGHASRDMYRGHFLRYGIYESNLDAYLAQVAGFQAKLEGESPGLSPLLLVAADVRVSRSLRVWDVVKALRLVRSASEGRPDREALLTTVLSRAEAHLASLDALSRSLDELSSAVEDAEIVPKNERLFHALSQLATGAEGIRSAIWDSLEELGVLPAGSLAAERTRELPR